MVAAVSRNASLVNIAEFLGWVLPSQSRRGHQAAGLWLLHRAPPGSQPVRTSDEEAVPIVADFAKAKMGSPLGAREETHMPTSVKQLMEAANAVVPKITPAEAREMMAKGNTLVVDVRDAPEN